MKHKLVSRKLREAESMRYRKIQNLIHLLQGKGNSIGIDAALGNDLPAPFKVGRRIAVDGEKIKIGKKSYSSCEIKKVTINTEGSMAMYDGFGKKLCGSLLLNASLNNVELLCIWIQKSNIPAEVVSGKGERLFQYMVVFFAVAAVITLQIL